MASMNTLRIHPELRALIPPLSEEERQQLIENLRADGCRDVLVIWQEENTILDGHNRYDICQMYELPFEVKTISLASLDEAKAWMLRHQLGRRNLLPDQLSYLRGKERELVGYKQGRPDKQTPQSAALKTDQQLADEHKVSTDTIQRDAAYAKAVDTIAAVAPEAKHDILSRDTKVARSDVKTLAALAKDSPQTARHVLEAVQAAPTPRAAKEVIRTAVKHHHALVASGVESDGLSQSPASAAPVVPEVTAASRKAYRLWMQTLTTLERLGNEIDGTVSLFDEGERSMLAQMIDVGLFALDHAIALLRPPPPVTAPHPRSSSRKGRPKAKKRSTHKTHKAQLPYGEKKAQLVATALTFPRFSVAQVTQALGQKSAWAGKAFHELVKTREVCDGKYLVHEPGTALPYVWVPTEER